MRTQVEPEVTVQGIKVATYTCPDMCELGNPQTFIRLRSFEEKYKDISKDSAFWNIKIGGTLTITKKGEEKYVIENGKKVKKYNEAVPNIKFKISKYHVNENDEKVYEKSYIRWTKMKDDSAKEEDKIAQITLKNIPLGLYEIKEIGSSNAKYPKEVQVDDIIKDVELMYELINVEIDNTPSYTVNVRKYDEDKKNIEGAKFVVQRGKIKTENNKDKFVIDEDGKISNLETDENGEAVSSLKLKKDSKETVYFRIVENSTNDNYYLNTDSDESPRLLIKYCNKEWTILKFENNKYVDDVKIGDKTVSVYRKGVKINANIDRDKDGEMEGLNVSFVNDKIATIALRKIDSDTNKRINGVKFIIYFDTGLKDRDGKAIYNYISDWKYDKEKELSKVTWTSSENSAKGFETGAGYGKNSYPDGVYSKDKNGNLITDGLIILKGVPKKNYYVKEVSVPDCNYNIPTKNVYKINDNDYKKSKITYDKGNYKIERYEYKAFFGNKKVINGKSQEVIENEPLRTIGITKVDNDNKSVTMNGVKFVIYYKKYNKDKKKSEKYYISKYQFDKNNNKKIVEYTKNENEAIQFITGINYLDGCTYYVAKESGVTHYENDKKEHPSLKNKPYDDGSEGKIILKGMESKKYYASEKNAGNPYYSADENKVYHTNGKCSGTNVNWITGNIQESGITYQIKLNKNEGEDGTDIIYLKDGILYNDSDCEDEMEKIEIPTNTNKRFKGYKFDENDDKFAIDSTGKLVPGGTLEELIQNNKYETGMELNAIWSDINDDENVYTITLERNNGTNKTDEIYLKQGALYSNKSCEEEITQINVPSKSGSTFKGYKIKTNDKTYSFDKNGMLVANGKLAKLIDNGSITKNITLTAIWGAETYEIKFEKNGGSGGTDSIYLRNGALYKDSNGKNKLDKIEVPKRPGYKFLGYKFNGAEQVYAFDSKGELVPDGSLAPNIDWYGSDMTLYAIWDDKVIVNQEKYVDISGYVWLDKHDGKNTTRDNVMNKNKDELLKGIKVKLKNKNGKTVQREDKTYYETETDKNGAYTFKNVNVDNLSKYYVEFEYNGIKYQCVAKRTDIKNGSKVSEGTEQEITKSDGTKKYEGTSRKVFNSKYATVKDSEIADNSPNESYVDILDKDNNKTVTLQYTTANYTANLNEGYDNNVFNKQVIHSETEIKDDNSSYLSEEYNKLKENMKGTIDPNTKICIENVNCGLYERAQSDIRLNKEVYNVKYSINGKDYNYGNYGVQAKQNVNEKFAEENVERTYERPIYESDYKWTGNVNKELKLKVTYLITLTSDSALNSKVNSFVDYYDKYYDQNSIKAYMGKWHYDNDKLIVESTSEELTTKTIDKELNTDYGGAIEINKEIKIAPKTSEYVFLEFELNRENIQEICEYNDKNKGNEYKLKNIAEINSYSTYDDGWETDNIYAALDKESAPGNAVPGKVETYENDTEGASKILISRKENRNITGKVFLDKSEKDDNKGGIRQGSGMYEEDQDDKVKNVKVQLVDENNNQAYNTSEYWTGDNGEYSISGFIPGDYKIQYIWGKQEKDGNTIETMTCDSKVTITVRNYKGTVYNKDEHKDVYWYKENSDKRYTDAFDNYEHRQKIDDEMKNITYGTWSNYSGDTDKNKMTSSTEKFSIDVENDEQNTAKVSDDGSTIEYKIENIDFGIVERAKQMIQLQKDVSNFRIILPNQTTELFNATIENGEIKGTPSYVRCNPDKNGIKGKGDIITEIDNEIIQGATAEIKYVFTCTNTSETDYATKEYYLYGEIPEDKDNSIVKIKPNTIVDYFDNNWKSYEEDENSKKWNSDSDKKGIIGNDLVYNDGKVIKDNGLAVLYAKDFCDKDLKPTDSNNKLELTVTKLLSSNKDGIILDNDAEIIQVTKSGGSQIQYQPGNYNHSKAGPDEPDDDKSATIRIMPTTGKNLDYATPIIITIVMLGIITTGIILIKKKVLGDKN